MEEAIADTRHLQEDILKDAYFAGHFDGEGSIYWTGSLSLNLEMPRRLKT